MARKVSGVRVRGKKINSHGVINKLKFFCDMPCYNFLTFFLRLRLTISRISEHEQLKLSCPFSHHDNVHNRKRESFSEISCLLGDGSNLID
jgi:hypothetical protein